MRSSYIGKLYSNGFFAFLCGAVLIGILLGTISYCSSDSAALNVFGAAREDFIAQRKEMDFGQIMISSLSGSTAFMAAAFLCGFCAVGQPLEILILIIRGIGVGMTLSQMYSAMGSSQILLCVGLYLPGTVISLIAVVFAVREAFAMSGIYLGITASDRQENGLRQSVKLYSVKFLVLETVTAAAAVADCVCNYFFIYKF